MSKVAIVCPFCSAPIVVEFWREAHGEEMVDIVEGECSCELSDDEFEQIVDVAVKAIAFED